MSEKPNTRLHVDLPLQAGQTLGLSADQAHYLRSVLRLDRGTTVALFNGRDGEFHGRIDGIGKGWCSIALGERVREQVVEPDLWLVFAPVKRSRIDFIAEKATELGVSALLPVMTARTAVERVNVERLTANATEAAEQTERLTVPVVHAPQPLGKLLDGWDEERPLILCDESGSAPPIAESVGRLPPGGKIAVLTGPEGGFTEVELDHLRKLPFVTPVSLGPRVLRADTAALAALAVLQAIIGDWRDRRFR